MRRRILIAEPVDFSPEAVERLRASADVELRAVERCELPDALRRYDVVWVRLGHRFDRVLLSHAEKCRVIATPVTGLDHIDLAACAEQGIRVVSLRGETEFLRTVRATAELTLALLLALLRRIPAACESTQAGKWQRDLFRGRELFGRKAGIVGVGRLGSIVAEYLQALGMDVAGHDPRPDYPSHIQRMDTLEQLLGWADIVSIHVNLAPATEGLIGDAEFRVMRPGAIVVNTARGGVLNEAALLKHLSDGHLGGAALDVLAGEPNIGAQHPLVRYAAEHDNLLITPHIGGNTIESFARTELFLAGRVLEALALLDAPAEVAS